LIGWLFVLKAPKNGQRSVSNFGLFFTVWYAAQFAIDFAFNPAAAYYANSVLLLPVSAIPLLWLKCGVLREMGKSRSEESGDLAGRLLKNYNISPREEEIIHLILQGKSNKEIQATLFISHHTVKNHVYNIYQKMNVKSRIQLMSAVLDRTASSTGAP
jgi:DNA-binding CsgD family transcriptional regulator